MTLPFALTALQAAPKDISTLGASALSSAVEALQDASTVALLVSASQRTARQAILHNLVQIANDDMRNTAARLLSIECLYHISSARDEAFLQGELFDCVQQFNASLEELMDGGSEAVEGQRGMLVVLLFRCSGYTRLKAGDLLRQMCGGDERRLVRLLVHMVQQRGCEWPLLIAAARCLYELTTPMSYFEAKETGAATQETRAESFLAKMTVLRDCLKQPDALPALLGELAARWALDAAGRPATAGLDSDAAALGPLGTPPLLHSVTTLTERQERALQQWTSLLHYLAVMLQNITDFTDDAADVRRLKDLLYASAQDFVATVAIAYVMAALHTWERAPPAPGTTFGETAVGKHVYTALLTMNSVRFVLHDHDAAPAPATLQALAQLTQQVTRLEPRMRTEHAGMLLMVITVDCLCNVRAVELGAAGEKTVNLAAALEVLLTTIAEDKTAPRADASCTTAQAFAICYAAVESPFRGDENETTALVHRLFAAEEDALRTNVQAVYVVATLEQQLQALQMFMMHCALSDLLDELCIDDIASGDNDGGLAMSSGATTAGAGAGSAATATTGKARASRQGSRGGRAKHPPEYCCQLTGRLMREPVTLKNGHHYEYSELMKVVDRVGHVDPITGEAINEAIEVDAGLQQEIARYRVMRAAAKENKQ